MAVVTGELRQATLQAERQLLGAIMVFSADGSTAAIDYCRGLIYPDDFLDSQYKDPLNQHTRIYKAMLEWNSMPPHQVGVAVKLSELNLLRDGDIRELIGMIADLDSCMDYEHYVQIVKRYAEQRNGIRRTKVVEI